MPSDWRLTMFVKLDNSILVSVAQTLAAQGFVLKPGCDVRKHIADTANRDFPRTDGNMWRYPKAPELQGIFYPAFKAAGSPVVEPVKTRKGKAAQAVQATSGKAQGARNHRPDCNCAMCLKIRGAASKPQASGKASKPQAVQAQAPQASGKLSQAQMEAIASAAAQAAVAALLKAI